MKEPHCQRDISCQPSFLSIFLSLFFPSTLFPDFLQTHGQENLTSPLESKNEPVERERLKRPEREGQSMDGNLEGLYTRN